MFDQNNVFSSKLFGHDSNFTWVGMCPILTELGCARFPKDKITLSGYLGARTKKSRSWSSKWRSNVITKVCFYFRPQKKFFLLFLFLWKLDLIDSSTDETKSIASCKAVSLIAGEAVTDNPNKKLEPEMDIKSYQQSDWKSLNHLAYREDNSLQQLVRYIFSALIEQNYKVWQMYNADRFHNNYSNFQNSFQNNFAKVQVICKSTRNLQCFSENMCETFANIVAFTGMTF